MLVNQNPSLLSAAETLYQLNMNEQFRETCDRFIRAEARENAHHRIRAELTQANEALTAQNSELAAEISELAAENSELAAENARLKALLAVNNTENKK